MVFADIRNKVAIITGGAEGIGLSIAKLLLEQGAKVILNDVNQALLHNEVKSLNDTYFGNVMAFPGDAGDLDIIDGMITKATDEYGSVDFAIANAGITLFGDFDRFAPDSFDQVVRVNLKGPFFLVQRLARVFKNQNREGRVILMSSNVGIRAYPHLTAYSMTKAALSMMARSLVLELAPYGITINAVAPGATLTKRTKRQEPDYEDMWSKIVPRKKVAKPEDIAKSCLFLLSDAAAHINGETLIVDGGWSVVGPYPEHTS